MGKEDRCPLLGGDECVPLAEANEALRGYDKMPQWSKDLRDELHAKDVEIRTLKMQLKKQISETEFERELRMMLAKGLSEATQALGWARKAYDLKGTSK